jgi:ATP-dependent RNA helicase DeaD
MQTFEEIAINPLLKQAIQDLGFVKPSPIQAETLPILLGEPTDFIGLAATGTGKTAAFGIPLLEKINPRNRQVQAVVMCPTRELCLQVSGQLNLLGKHLRVHALPIYGGAGYEDQMQGLKRGAQVVVGTPGRMIDHLRRGTLKLDGVKIAVLDEADEMISMGFREDMETILSNVPREQSNIWLFSATMSSSVRAVASEFLKEPKKVEVNRAEMLSTTVEQYFYMTQEKNKAEVLCKLIDAAEDFYGIVFCQTKVLTIDLTRYLANRGYRVDSLHGDMTQGAREAVMNRFRSKGLRILVCTDVAARGLDVKDVSHVVNYSLPRELDSYVHRIGRTARSGKTGIAMALVTPSHRYLLAKIERMTKSKILEGVIPTRKAVGVKKVGTVLNKLVAQTGHPRAMELMETAWKESLEGMSKEEIAGRFLALMFPEIFNDERQAGMQRTDRQAQGERAAREERGPHAVRDEQAVREERPARRDFRARRDRPRFKTPFHKRAKGGGNYPPRRKST